MLRGHEGGTYLTLKSLTNWDELSLTKLWYCSERKAQTEPADWGQKYADCDDCMVPNLVFFPLLSAE